MHMHSAIDMIYPLILSGILLHISDEAVINALNIGVKSGSPGIFPCLYDKKHKENRKYWCKGTHWVSCSILTYANDKGKYSLTDYPAQSIFTVQWENLQTSDSGYYWCAVEIGDYGTLDDRYYLYLTVQSAPDVSVVSSSVSGHEGGDISVQCVYSSDYQNKLKQWCRYKDQSCYTVGRTVTSQNSSVQISDDDGRRSFTVLMTGLRLNDSGWYRCSAGEALSPVHITVTEAETNKGKDISEPGHDKNNNTTKVIDKPQKDHELLTVWLPVSAALLLLLILIGVFIWRWRQRPKENEQQIRERNGSRNNDTIYSKPEDPVIYSTINDEDPNDANKDITTYSTIDHVPGSEAKPPAGGTTYSTVAPQQQQQ
uniref:Ig-like domain-containing protein n=1 Tax=Cyprinus carpio carpio TaxID=630221 RepID=A0A9J8BZN8_CYPCA